MVEVFLLTQDEKYMLQLNCQSVATKTNRTLGSVYSDLKNVKSCHARMHRTKGFLRSIVRARIGKANGLEICRTHKQHPHGTTDRLTVELDFARVLADTNLKCDRESKFGNELHHKALGIDSIRLLNVEKVIH